MTLLKQSESAPVKQETTHFNFNKYLHYTKEMKWNFQ